MLNMQIETAKLKNMEAKLNCKFGDIAYIHYTHLEKWYKKLGYETIARFSIL